MGNKRVVADSSRCIGCQTCMAACIEAHDIPGNIAAPRLRVITDDLASALVALWVLLMAVILPLIVEIFVDRWYYGTNAFDK